MAHYEWAVVGAGPAGIAAVGKLLDAGIHPEKIAWFDPAFTVGDVGARWRGVPSNTTVELFLQFLYASHSFQFSNAPEACKLKHLAQEQTCLLQEVVQPLQWVTDVLKAQVAVHQSQVHHLALKNGAWCIDYAYTARQVVLAIGAEPINLDHEKPQTISLVDALNPDQLSQCVSSTDTVAVFGSSHSAVLVLKKLCELNVKAIHNFYRSPLRYAIYLPERILFDNTGLKGTAASWARQCLDGCWPPNLFRHEATEANVALHLAQCNKAVYAVGFAPRKLAVEGVDLSQYNDKYGILAPGLFGVGIAFPEGRYDCSMNFEYNVGMWKFMHYLQRVLPIWMRYASS